MVTKQQLEVRENDMVGQREGLVSSRVFWTSGLVLMLCAFYPNYGATFDEGQVQGAGAPVLALKSAAALCLLLGAKSATRLRYFSAALSTILAVAALLYGLTLAVGDGPGDRLFVNQLLLWIPIAAMAVRWDEKRWSATMDTVVAVVVCQAAIDALVVLSGRSLWESQAFVGGAGNGSTFALLCTVCLSYVLFRGRGLVDVALASALIVAVFLTKSLFGIVSASGVVAVWYALNARKPAVLVGVPAVTVAALSVATWWILESGGIGAFVLRKLESLGGFIGVIENAPITSESILHRVDIHFDYAATFLETVPRALLGGAVTGSYYGVDSQLLTFAGSFGLLLTVVWALLHAALGVVLWRMPDGCVRRVSLVHFGLFTGMFFVNRVLDYYPAAFFYFMLYVVADSARRAHPGDVRADVHGASS